MVLGEPFFQTQTFRRPISLTASLSDLSPGIPNIRQYLRFEAVLQFETCATGVRTQPPWLSPLASLNLSNSRGSLLTPPRLLTLRLREGDRLDIFELA